MGFLLKLVILIIVVGVVLTYLGYKVDFNLNIFKPSQENQSENGLAENQPAAPLESVSEQQLINSSSITESLPQLPQTCSYNQNCTSGLLCIDGTCKTIAELYNTDCEQTCSITAVSLSTSDGENYHLKLGMGSYSMAGALVWKLLTTPKYCPEASPLIPIQITSKSGGQVIAEQVITLRESETSKPISHALSAEKQFTITLNNITESCS